MRASCNVVWPCVVSDAGCEDSGPALKAVEESDTCSDSCGDTDSSEGTWVRAIRAGAARDRCTGRVRRGTLSNTWNAPTTQATCWWTAPWRTRSRPARAAATRTRPTRRARGSGQSTSSACPSTTAFGRSAPWDRCVSGVVLQHWGGYLSIIPRVVVVVMPTLGVSDEMLLVLSCRPRRRSAWTSRDTSGYPFEERKEPGLRLPRVECTVRVCV
jgi:hypothetical protein